MNFKIIFGMVTFILFIIGILCLGMEYMWINYALITWASVDIGLTLLNHFGFGLNWLGFKTNKYDNLKKKVKEIEKE